jgi:hypothetical protein
MLRARKSRIYGEFYFSFVTGFLVPVPDSGCGIWGSRYTVIPVTYMTVDQQPAAVTVETSQHTVLHRALLGASLFIT